MALYKTEKLDIIDGSTVNPTNNVLMWLKCANLHQTYTTLSDVLADDDVMEKLFRSENASDYLVRSTTWASDITANQTAMILIGKNDYCANKLLEDNTWSAAICASTYWDKVLSGLVPTMTDYNAPQGLVEGIGYNTQTTRYPWKVFDGSLDILNNQWQYLSTSGWVQYTFTSATKVNFFKILPSTSASGSRVKEFQILASNDNFVTSDLLLSEVLENVYETQTWFEFIIPNNNKYSTYRINILNSYDSSSCGIIEAQFYGRVPQTTIYSAANDIVSFIDDEGAKVVTTDATGKGEVTIVCKPNTDITFTSSVAKNPDNLSENYSKVVTVKSNGDAVYVMPNKNTLYWYGYKSLEYQVVSTANGWVNSGDTFEVPTENTNYVTLTARTPNPYDYRCAFVYKNKHTVNKAYAITQGITIGAGRYATINALSSKTYATSIIGVSNNTNQSLSKFELDCSSYGEAYIAIQTVNGGSVNVYALWYDDSDSDDKAEISSIATNEPNATASKAYAAGEHFYKNGKFCTAKTAIASGATFTLGTNYTEGTVAEFVGFPLISEMTTPAVVSSRAKNIVGGYKQVGKTVYVDIEFKVGSAMSTGGIAPEVSFYEIFSGLPMPYSSYSPLEITIFHPATIRLMAAWALVKKITGGGGSLDIGQTATSSNQINENDYVHVRGTYEAN